jgi:peptidoglycan/LPS O-acetylase OafA/YrhL
MAAPQIEATPTATPASLANRGPDRLDFIDNIRSMTIVLVVAMHAAVTYSNFGNWYIKDPAPTDKLQLLLFGLGQSSLQAWFMGFLFLMAGYFVPPSFDRKGAGKFIGDRAFRLGLPSAIYILVVHPFIVYGMLSLYNQGHVASADRWLHYLTSGEFLSGTGPMWFAVALLAFCLVYAGFASISTWRLSLAPPTWASVAVLISAIAVCSFLARTAYPIGTAILNMQPGYFSQYVILFTVGIAARRAGWLTRIPYDFGMRWFRIAWLGGIPLWFALFIGGGALSGTDVEVFKGGWHWQSAVNALWEALACAGTCLGLIVFFRERFNRRGKLAAFFADNSFAVYMFHPPILIGVTMALRGFGVPAIVKFAIATALATAASFLASHFVFRRTPFLKNVL